MAETAKALAATRGVSVEEIARETTANFFRLFNKVPGIPATAAPVAPAAPAASA